MIEHKRKGGLRLQEKYGPHYHSFLGAEGGAETLRRYGKEYFSEMGKRSQRRQKELRDKGRQAEIHEPRLD